MTWVAGCAVDDVEPEDVVGFEHDGVSYAIVRNPEGEFFASDGLCTHERACLADGLVMGATIECPKHNGRFDYRTGAATRRPAREPLRTYPVAVRDGRVWIEIT